jgi:hypothetical protein
MLRNEDGARLKEPSDEVFIFVMSDCADVSLEVAIVLAVVGVGEKRWLMNVLDASWMPLS